MIVEGVRLWLTKWDAIASECDSFGLTIEGI